MLREMPSPFSAPEEEVAPESREIPVAFGVERDEDALRITVHDERVHDALAHVLLNRFPLDAVHQRRSLGILHFTVDGAQTLTDEDIDQLKEAVAVATRRAHAQPFVEDANEKPARAA